MINREELMHCFYLYDYQYNRNKAETLRVLFQKYLNENPSDTEIWIKFVLLLYLGPLHEDLSAIKCINKILDYEPNNIQVLLILFYIYEHLGTAKPELLEKISTINTDDQEIKSMIEYGKSWYYQDRDNFADYEKCLIKSIELCDQHVSNYISLGIYYLKIGKLIKGFELMKKGLNNVKKVMDDEYKYDTLDIEEFFNERFKGIHITDINYDIILESFDPESPWVTGDFITKKGKKDIDIT